MKVRELSVAVAELDQALSDEYRDLWEMFSEVFLSQIYWVPLPERPGIIDCGSNVGCATLYFKLLAPRAGIICFEPNPVAFSYLKENVDKNKFTEVSLVQAACGKEDGVPAGANWGPN